MHGLNSTSLSFHRSPPFLPTSHSLSLSLRASLVRFPPQPFRKSQFRPSLLLLLAWYCRRFITFCQKPRHLSYRNPPNAFFTTCITLHATKTSFLASTSSLQLFYVPPESLLYNIRAYSPPPLLHLLDSLLFPPSRMAFSPSFHLLLLLFLAFFLSPSSSLGDDAVDASTSKTYIIGVRNDLKPSVFSDVEHWYSSTLQALSSSTHSLESSSRRTRGKRKLLHVYRTVFHGFSAVLTSFEAELLRSIPAVLAILPDRPRQLHTTRSPFFLGLVSADSKPNSLLAATDFGSSVVVALVDTGIRPDHRSFADDGRLPPPPSSWNGSCDAPSLATPPASHPALPPAPELPPTRSAGPRGATTPISSPALTPPFPTGPT